MTQGKIIVLNGPSSSGKSSISKALQDRLNECYLHFQQDAFWDMVPDGVAANSENFPLIKYAVIDSVYALLIRGHNVIMDTVSMPEHMEFLKEKLSDFDANIVAVTADLDVLQKRELDRGDRIIGLSQSQHDLIHEGTEYDLIVNTSDKTAEQSAELILRKLKLQQV